MVRRVKRIVCKFGGSSVASGGQLRKVKSIIESDPRRRVIVVSAPGKRVSSEAKVTDLLYLAHEMATMGVDYSSPIAMIRQRFAEIETELGISSKVNADIDALAETLAAGCTRDYVASRGEALNARLIAEYLEAELIDPIEHVVIMPNGLVDPVSYPSLKAAFADEKKRYVMAGFYGRDKAGNIKTFSRGGSDISGAIAARAIEAEVYENWTDVSGLLMADPRIVDEPRSVPEMSYRELRELAYMGATVLHDEAILPVREVNIPVNIKNTNRPDDIGTMIVPKLSEETIKGTEIAGVAGKAGFSMICIEKSLMNKEIGFTHRALGVLARHGVSVEHCPSSIDGLNIIVDAGQLKANEEVILEELKRTLQPDGFSVEELALVAVVGEGMSHAIGIAAKVFEALRDSKSNVRVINQGASELNILVGVEPKDLNQAIQGIYKVFVSERATQN